MEYKVSELAEKAGVTKRTIHYYISKGLLMPPKGSGVNSIYSDEHLERILLIKELQNSYMPLSKIRDYILEHPENEIREESLDRAEGVRVRTIVPHEETDGKDVYIRENIHGIFEMHYTKESYEKNKYIIENVKKYVEKLMED